MGTWQPGQSANPAGGKHGHHNGRPLGGRSHALRTLDAPLAESKSQKQIRNIPADELGNNALSFFKTIIVPLLPRESEIEVDATGVVQRQGLVTLPPVPTEPGKPFTTIAGTRPTSWLAGQARKPSHSWPSYTKPSYTKRVYIPPYDVFILPSPSGLI